MNVRLSHPSEVRREAWESVRKTDFGKLMTCAREACRQSPGLRAPVLLIALVWAPSMARAQTETATVADDTYVLPAEGARTITWYGWETLSFDATFGVAVLASAIVLAHQNQRE